MANFITTTTQENLKSKAQKYHLDLNDFVLCLLEIADSNPDIILAKSIQESVRGRCNNYVLIDIGKSATNCNLPAFVISVSSNSKYSYSYTIDEKFRAMPFYEKVETIVTFIEDMTSWS